MQPDNVSLGDIRARVLQGFCNTYLVQALPPQQTRPITMLTSNFSHSGLVHLGINMLAFSGFGGAVCQVRMRMPTVLLVALAHAHLLAGIKLGVASCWFAAFYCGVLAIQDVHPVSKFECCYGIVIQHAVKC